MLNIDRERLLLYKTKNNFIDLDNTLKINSVIFRHSLDLIKILNATILTNNCDLPPTQLLFSEHTEVISPINNAKTIILREQLKPFIIGLPEIKEYLNFVKSDDLKYYDSIFICGHLLKENITNIAIFIELIKRINAIHVYENFYEEKLSETEDHNLSIDVKIPYIGKLLEIFDYKGQIIEIGKNSYKNDNFGIMIGDRLDTDGYVCEKNNGLFIHILNNDSNMHWNGMYFTVGNVDILYKCLFELK